MNITKGKSLLLILFMLFVSFTLLDHSLKAQSSANLYLDPPAIADQNLTQGKTFSINVTVSDVEDLSGFSLTIQYNTSVLTVTAYNSYDPFTVPGFSRINDTGGFVYVYFTMPLGSQQGVSGTVPLVKIDFTVDAEGVTILNLGNTKLSNTKGISISHTVTDGAFANTPVHDVAVLSLTASPARVEPGGLVSLTVTVANEGEFNEIFNLSITYSPTVPHIGNQTNQLLAIGENATRTFSWNTTGLADGEYTVEAKATIAFDHYPSDNIKTAKVRVGVIRDVAVTNVTTSQFEAAIGELIIVRVTIKNLGDFTETVTVQAKGNTTLIGTTTNQKLEPKGQNTLTFNWKTQDVTVGDYILVGEATVDADDNPANNVREGDIVSIIGTSGIPTIFLYFGAGLLVIIFAAVILRFALRSRKSKPA